MYFIRKSKFLKNDSKNLIESYFGKTEFLPNYSKSNLAKKSQEKIALNFKVLIKQIPFN